MNEKYHFACQNDDRMHQEKTLQHLALLKEKEKRITGKSLGQPVDKRGHFVNLIGKIVSEKYKRMVSVRDAQGGAYVCCRNDLSSPDEVAEAEK